MVRGSRSPRTSVTTGPRFVCLLNMQCLLNRRGSTSRDALDTLRRWVPDLTSNLPAFSFVFTPATDPTVHTWTEEQVAAWREHLCRQIQLVKDLGKNQYLSSQSETRVVHEQVREPHPNQLVRMNCLALKTREKARRFI